MMDTLQKISAILLFLLVGCSSIENSTQTQKHNSKQKTVVYSIKTSSSLPNINTAFIENRFKDLKNLSFPYVKIYYNHNGTMKFDCEMNVVFDTLTIQDKEYSNNKHFSKVVREQMQPIDSDSKPMVSSETIRGYVYQKTKERKLNCKITIKTNSNSENCKLSNYSFTETLISKSVNNTLSGDERAISKKYKYAIALPLKSKKNMTEELIDEVYKKTIIMIKNDFKK